MPTEQQEDVAHRMQMYKDSPNRSVLFSADVKSKQFKGFEARAGQVMNLPWQALVAARSEFGSSKVFDITAKPLSIVVNRMYGNSQPKTPRP